MKMRYWILVVIGMICDMAEAEIQVRTNISDIYYRGAYEEVGAITLNVRGDDFFRASQAQPDYIRIRLEPGAVLRETLVDLQGSMVGHEPIYLACRLEGVATDFRIALEPQSVAIVRWRMGEEDIWLRVSQSTGNWIEHIPSSTFQAPSTDLGVSFTLGVPATGSWALNQGLLPLGIANMRANSRQTFPLSLADAEDTLLVIDLRQSSDLPFPDLSSNVLTDYVAFTDCLGVTSEPDPLDITIGPQTPVVFSGDSVVGRGFELAFLYGMWPVLDISGLVRHLGP